MFSHIMVGVADIERALTFYEPLMAILGRPIRFREKAWVGWQTSEDDQTLFLICLPYDGGPASVGNGSMTALLAADRPTVDAAYAAAMAAGGVSEGEPGPRPHYHDRYYGAYFRDLDGNKLCVVCHV